MWKYIGKGSFALGIPAKDLSEDEADQIGVERLIACGLYEHVEEKAKTKAPLNKAQFPEPQNKKKGDK